MKSYSSREVIKMILEDGWYLSLIHIFELMDSKVKIWNTGDKIKIKRTASREEAAEA